MISQGQSTGVRAWQALSPWTRLLESAPFGWSRPNVSHMGRKKGVVMSGYRSTPPGDPGRERVRRSSDQLNQANPSIFAWIGWSGFDELGKSLAAVPRLNPSAAFFKRRAGSPGRPICRPRREGRQYASEQFQRLMTDNGVDCLTSRSGNAWGNAAVESFFSSLETERIGRKVYRMRGAVVTVALRSGRSARANDPRIGSPAPSKF